MPTALYLLILLVIYTTYRYLFYPLVCSPLARIPSAHPTAALSPGWILWTRYIGKENVSVYEAHTRLGPLVKLSPNEISVNCVEGGIRTIYSGGYEKGKWYSNVFANYGVDCMFSMEGRGPHGARKRMLSNIYAKSVLLASPAMAQICAEVCYNRMVPRVAETPKSILDAYELFCAVTMDGVTAYIFGLEQGSNHTRDKDLGAKWLRDYKARQEYIFWPQELAGLTNAFTYFGLRHLLIPKWVDQANADIEAWTLTMCDAAESAISTRMTSPPGDRPAVYGQLRASMKKQEKDDIGKQGDRPSATQRLEIASEMLDHLAAGFDTSGIVLTYLGWQVSRPQNAGIQAALRKELHSLKPGIVPARDTKLNMSMPDPKDVDALPLLHAVVMETLRLHAAIPGGQPRVTPANASLGPPGKEIHGVPAGVRVVSYAHSLHRNPEVFPEPEEWRPERWLDSEGRISVSAEKSRWFWAFGSGGRMCIGSNFAIMEIKHVVTALWSNFATTIVDDTGMIPAGRYTDEPVGSPEGNYLLLHFEKLRNSSI